MSLRDGMLVPAAAIRPAIFSSIISSPSETDLDCFDRQFVAVTAISHDMVRRAQEIRYQVYCVEHPFENAADHPDGLEKDEFDTHAVHSLLLHRPSGYAMGTVRLVLPRRDAPERSFAIQQAVDHPILHDPRLFPIRAMAEVSRFSISKQFRHVRTESPYGFDTHASAAASTTRRNGPLMRLGLIQALVRMSAEQGITHWCAMMEPKLLRMLASISIYFRPIGALVEYHGLRQPCFCNVAEMLDRVRQEQLSVWEVLTNGGELWDAFSDSPPQRNCA